MVPLMAQQLLPSRRGSVLWPPGNVLAERQQEQGKMTFACGSTLNRRGKPQVLIHVSTHQGSILVPVF